ncbi:MAG: uroporphyrinogen decarboxylase family protein, partial [Phycisphaerae bacterium]
AAFRDQDVDHLPCSIYFNDNLQVQGYNLNDWREHIRLQLDLGCDPVAAINISGSPHPHVTTRTWLEDVHGEVHPILFKEYRTAAGVLRMGVRHTPDWPGGMDIPWNDHSASNMFEPLLKSPEDVDAFAYVWQAPTQSDLDAYHDDIEAAVSVARERQLTVQGYAGAGLAILMFVMGAENMVMFAADYPEAFKRLAEIESRTNIERIKLSAQIGVDILKRFGGYEQTNFCSPAVFRQVVTPLLKQEVQAAHDAGLLIYYRVVTDFEPFLDDIASLGFDCVEGGEPCLSNCSFEMWHEALGGRAGSWTGISTPVLLGGKDPDAVRREVNHCVDVFGKKGFILGVTNSIRNHFPWDNTLDMIDEWKKVR